MEFSYYLKKYKDQKALQRKMRRFDQTVNRFKDEQTYKQQKEAAINGIKASLRRLEMLSDDY